MINYKDLNLNEEDLDSLYEQLKTRKEKDVYEKHIDAIDNNKQYIGKCYYDNKHDKYIRVLSAKSSNEYRLECMCFEFPISFTEENKFMTRIFNPQYAFSEINFDGIYIEDYPLLCNCGAKTQKDVLKEITEDEYFEAMNRYIKELQDKIKDNYFDTSKNNKSIFKK